MARRVRQSFGGDWTEQKLQTLKKYMWSYVTILKTRDYRYSYIDAFAGTGYRELKAENQDQPLFPELAAESAQRYLKGSARIALEADPPFDRYVFVERSATRVKELQSLCDEFPHLADRTLIRQWDANDYLLRIGGKVWKNDRALVFLDPFAMQVRWEAIEALGVTKAVDVWILFPLSAVARLLRHDGQIEPSWRARLDEIFGTSEWFQRLYSTQVEPGLFDDQEEFATDTRPILRREHWTAIGAFFVERLKTCYAHVLEEPAPLLGPTNSPLFLLCFAAANPHAKSAVKIARDLVRGLNR